MKTAIAQFHDSATAYSERYNIPDTFQGQIINHVPLSQPDKIVALTFDDGPWGTSTSQVLDILKQYDVRATFFWVGQHLKRYPQIAKQIMESGHAVGNHSWSHPIHVQSPGRAAAEIDQTDQLIQELTGTKTELFRPPGGFLDTGLSDYAQQQGKAIMMWSADSKDYYVSAPVLIDNVLSNVTPGGIILLHDGGGDRSATVQALPMIITALRQQGYEFVTVPELMKRAVSPTAAPTIPQTAPTFSAPAAAPSPSAAPAIQSAPRSAPQPAPRSAPQPTPSPGSPSSRPFVPDIPRF
jgi:chitin deacetylase